jgi:glucose-1-phosphatase
MIRAVVFDIGGVLLRTENRAGRRHLEEKFGLSAGGVDALVFDSQAALRSTLGKEEELAVWKSVAQKLKLSPKALAEFKNAFWSGDRVDQKLIEFLQEIRQDYKTALLTNAWENARLTLSRKYGIKEGETVDTLLISSELGLAKPDPKIFSVLANTLECNYPEILFVDDFIENVIAARRLGIQAIHYHPGMDLISKVRQRINQD